MDETCVDADGHSRSGDPSDPADLGGAPRTEAQGRAAAGRDRARARATSMRKKRRCAARGLTTAERRSGTPTRNPELVCRPRMGAAAPPARHAAPRAGREKRLAGRRDRLRQDACGLPSDHFGIGRAADRGAPHPLHLAAEGAGGRRSAQPHRPDRGDGSPYPRRDAHRRHAVRQEGTAAGPAAADPADDT